jgi:hypothetical protein
LYSIFVSSNNQKRIIMTTVSITQIDTLAAELANDANIKLEAASRIINQAWGNNVTCIMPMPAEWLKNIPVYTTNTLGQSREMIFSRTGRYLYTRKAK